jgi:menaquinone-dependent protoporphyrinogen oxidase
MRVLIAFASRYGATMGIAENIAVTLRRQGIEATAQPAEQAADPVGYDAVIIGSAVYYFRWMKPAVDFVRLNRTALANLPVWLFSSGPLGVKEKDEKGRDMREFLVPREIAEFRQAINPRDHRVFFGAFDSTKLGFTHRLISKLPANRDDALFPRGDFRNWAEIEGWSNSIADALWAS